MYPEQVRDIASTKNQDVKGINTSHTSRTVFTTY